MRIIFYKEDPTWYFSNDDLVKNKPAPEHYVLDTGNDSPDNYCVFETHSVDDNESTKKCCFSDLRESQKFYRERREQIISLGFGYQRDSDPT